VTSPRAPARAEALAREHPDWQSWLGLVQSALEEARNPAWTAAVPPPPGPRPPGVPWLAGLTAVVDGPAARRWIARLFETAARGADPSAGLARAPVRKLDPAELLEAGVRDDRERLAAMAVGLGAAPEAFAVVAPLAAVPLLMACRRAAGVVAGWDRGSCPVCGAWPTLAELRGLEGERRLRCGRCASDWRLEWLTCPFCGARDHADLGALVPDGDGRRRVETCRRCLGYLKTLTTLAATPDAELALEDLATVDLDVAALDQGYRRPEAPGHRLDTRVVAAASGAGRRLRALFRASR
jgi:FdhE protein